MKYRLGKLICVVLFCITLSPVFGEAKTETFAERKQRIMRKYLREDAQVTVGEPIFVELSKEEIELENERRKQDRASALADRSTGSPLVPTGMNRPMVRPQPQKKSTSLFDKSSTEASEEVVEEEIGIQNQSNWATKTDKSASYRLPAEEKSSFSGKSLQSETYKGYQPRSYGFGTRAEAETKPQGYQMPSVGSGFKGTRTTGGSTLYGESSENSTLNQPGLQGYSPFRYSADTGSEDRSQQYRTPYKSPYSTSSYTTPSYNTGQTDKGKSSWQQQSQPAYKMKQQKPSTYNPASGESYADELMRKSKNR